MTKFILPIQDDTLDSVAALLKFSLKADDREKINSIVASFKQAPSIEIPQDVLVGEEATSAIAGIILLAIASKAREE